MCAFYDVSQSIFICILSPWRYLRRREVDFRFFSALNKRCIFFNFFLLHSFSCFFNLHTEKSFRNLIKSNRNKIVYTIFRLIWNQTDTVRLLFQINRCMVNTIWFQVDLIRFRKNFSVCASHWVRTFETQFRSIFNCPIIGENNNMHYYICIPEASYGVLFWEFMYVVAPP